MYRAASGTVKPFFSQAGYQSVAFRMNNASVAVGIHVQGVLVTQSHNQWHGFTGTFTGGGVDFAPVSPRGGVTQPLGINDANEIVGFSGSYTLGWAPFIYLPVPNYGLPAGLQEIGPPTAPVKEPQLGDSSTLVGLFRYPPHEAKLNAVGHAIFNYASSNAPGFWQLGHLWDVTSLVNNLQTNQAVAFAEDLNDRAEIVATLNRPAVGAGVELAVLRPLLGAGLALLPGACPGDPFTVRLTLTNQSSGTLTQLSSPGLEWHGPGTFAILQGPAVVGPDTLPAGQMGDLTWLVPLPAGSGSGSFLSQARRAMPPTASSTVFSRKARPDSASFFARTLPPPLRT